MPALTTCGRRRRYVRLRRAVSRHSPLAAVSQTGRAASDSGGRPGHPANPDLRLADWGGLTGQAALIYGPEGAVSATALLILDRRAGQGSDQSVARYVERFSPNTITAVLVGVAGLTFLLKAGGGLYWLIPAAAASLLGGVVNAWLFLVKVTS